MEAVQRCVCAAALRGRRIKAVGAGHSFTDIAVAPDVLLDLRDLSGVVDIDVDRSRVTLRAGTHLHQIPALLEPYGLAMQTLGDIDRQTIAGAISTGTHGTGARFGGIASQVVAATLVTAAGELIVIDEEQNAALLPAVALGLGALGVLVDVTIQCVPTFIVHAVEQPEPLERVLEELDDRVEGADHFEFYWFPHTDRAMTKTNTRMPRFAPRHSLSPVEKWIDDVFVGSVLHQASASVASAIPVTVPVINRVAARVWGNREFTDVPHNVFTTLRAVRFHEMEYAIPASSVGAAFRAVRALFDERGWNISFPIEVRFSAADDLWMSPAHTRATGYIAVHRYWREDYTECFDAVEEILTSFDGRPHWGKLHSQDAATLRACYPRFDDFVALRDRLDPERMFQNSYLERVIGE